MEPVEAQDCIDLGLVYCACGCGQEATQLYKGIPIPSTNPATHLRAYKARLLAEQWKAQGLTENEG